MQRTKYLLKNTAIFAVGSISTKLISFLLVPFYTYMLTPEEYGILDLIFVYITIFSPLVMLNIGDGVMRFAMDKENTKTEILTVGSIVVIFGAIVSLLLFPIFSNSALYTDYAILIILYLITFSSNIVFLAYLRGAELIVEYTICNIVSSLMIALLNIFFLVQLRMGIKGYLLAYIISYTFVNVLSIFLGKQYTVFKDFKFNKTLFKQMMKYSMALVPNSLLWWVINSSDRLMVANMVGISAAGVYAVSYKIPSILSVFSNIFFQAWGYSAVNEMNSEDNLNYNNDIFKKLVSFLGLVSGAVFLIMEPLVRLLFQKSYFLSWQPSLFLVAGFYFLSIATFVATPYFTYKNSFGSMLSSLIGGVTNIILNFVLIPSFGINGAAIATLISYIIVLIFRIFNTRKYLKLQILNRTNILTTILLIVMILTAIMLTHFKLIALILEYIILIIVNRHFLKETVQLFRDFRR